MRLGKLTLSRAAILTLSSLGAGQPPEQLPSMDVRRRRVCFGAVSLS
jgi:hypothetical protein